LWCRIKDREVLFPSTWHARFVVGWTCMGHRAPGPREMRIDDPAWQFMISQSCPAKRRAARNGNSAPSNAIGYATSEFQPSPPSKVGEAIADSLQRRGGSSCKDDARFRIPPRGQREALSDHRPQRKCAQSAMRLLIFSANNFSGLMAKLASPLHEQ